MERASASGPRDRKEGAPQPKRGEAPVAATRPAVVGVSGGRSGGKTAVGVPDRSLETEPPDLPPLAQQRDHFRYLASPRTRTGVFIGLHTFQDRPVQARQVDPELVYERRNLYIVAHVGGAFTYKRFEVSIDVPFVGLADNDYYQQGEMVRTVRKTDRANLSVAIKYSALWRVRGHLFLLAPFLVAELPSGTREQYQVNLAGQQVVKETSGPRVAAVLPGVSAGWRYGRWSAVVSLGADLWYTLRDAYYDVPLGASAPPQPSVALQAAYQLGVTVVRDVVLTLALHQVNELVPRRDDMDNDALYLVPGIRLQPYRGLYGQVGISVLLRRSAHQSRWGMITLQMGYEFR
jgi:hypothetical protein